MQLPLLHHKLEAYKYVNQQVANRKRITDDNTIALVATLGLMEAAMWETNGGSLTPIVTHIEGLQKIMALAKGSGEDLPGTLFQRTVKMYVEALHSWPRAV